MADETETPDPGEDKETDQPDPNEPELQDAEPHDEPDVEDIDDEDEPASGDEPDEDDPERPAAGGARRKPDETIRELRARAQKAERERDEWMRRQNGGPRVDPAEAQRQYEQREAELLRQATEAEQMGGTGAVSRYYFERGQREGAARLQNLQNTQFEREDSREFRQICRDDGISAEMRDFVEDRIQAARASGNYALTREALLNHELGLRARMGKAERLGRQTERAGKRLQRQTVKPPRGGSDVAPSRSRKKEADWTAEDYERQLASRSLIG